VSRQSCSRIGGALAAQPAGLGGQAFEAAHARVRTLVQALAAGGGQQCVGKARLPALGAGRKKLRAQHVGIAIDDQPGQSIGLAVHQAHTVAFDRQPGAQCQRLADAAREEGLVDVLAFVEAPRPHPDLRACAVGAPGQEAAVVRLDAHRLAAVAAALVHAAGKDPGVALEQRAFLALAQADRLHGAAAFFFARGCAAS
jgi:hypothetical protein